MASVLRAPWEAGCDDVSLMEGQMAVCVRGGVASSCISWPAVWQLVLYADSAVQYWQWKAKFRN